MITQEELKRRFHYDPLTGQFTRLKGKSISLKPRRYLLIMIDGKQYAAHRLAFVYMGATVPPMVDHKNCDPTDNRWDNLRPATSTENNRNALRRSDNRSGVKGVSLNAATGKYKATIRYNGKRIHLGYFSDLESAAEAYAKAAHELHKSFANIGVTNVRSEYEL